MYDLKLFASNESSFKEALEEVRVYSAAVGMKFSLAKCAVCYITRGKADDSGNLILVDGDIIKDLGAGESYKY